MKKKKKAAAAAVAAQAGSSTTEDEDGGAAGGGSGRTRNRARARARARALGQAVLPDGHGGGGGAVLGVGGGGGVDPPVLPALGQAVLPGGHGVGGGVVLGGGGDGDAVDPPVLPALGQGDLPDGDNDGDGGGAGRRCWVGAGAVVSAGRAGWLGPGALGAGGRPPDTGNVAWVGGEDYVFVGPCGWAIVGGGDLAEGRVPVEQPADVVQENEVPWDSRKKGKKAKKRNKGNLSDSEYNHPPPAHENAALVAALKRCKAYEQLALEVKALNRVPSQSSMADIPEIFCDSDLSPVHLADYCQRKQEFYLNTYPRKIAVRLEDGSLVVACVTPNKEPGASARTYHVVSLVRTADQTKAKVLVENYSGYAVAFKVVYLGEDEELIPWCNFGNEELDEKLLGKQRRIKRGPAYTHQLEHIVIEDGVGDKIINFMASFRGSPDDPADNYEQEISDVGDALIDTVIVFACEAPRFGLAEYYVVHTRGRIPTNLSECLKDWLSTCKCIYLLVKYLEEKTLSRVKGDLMSKISAVSKKACTELWNDCQEPLSHTEMQFFKKAPRGTVQEVPHLNKLAGTHLKLLRNDEELWDQIIMRQLGYDGAWMHKIGHAPPIGADQGSAVGAEEGS